MNTLIRVVPLRVVLLALLLVSVSGCVIIERKTLVVYMPEKADTIELYCVFEGMSVMEGEFDSSFIFSKRLKSTLDTAESHLTEYKKKDLCFWTYPDIGRKYGSWTENSDPDNSPIGELKFYLDPARERKLCAHRRATVKSRAERVKLLSQSIDEVAGKLDTKDFRAAVRTWKETFTPHGQRTDLPFLKMLLGACDLADQLDDDSLDKVKKAGAKGFNWLRIEGQEIRFVIPTTPQCARKIATDKNTPKRLKEIATLMPALAIEVVDDGLAIVIGKKDEPLRLTYPDGRAYQDKLEPGLIRAAGSPKELMINGKAANAEVLIERFLMEVRKQPRYSWSRE